MYIVYGVNPIHLVSHTLPIACSNCNHAQQQIDVYKNYFSLFWIPLIPFFRKAHVMCPSCKQEVEGVEFVKQQMARGESEETIQSKLNAVIKSAKEPLYPKIFQALVVLAIVIFYACYLYASQQMKKAIEMYLENPAANVLLVLKADDLGDYPYMVCYVSQVEGDMLVLQEWKYSYGSRRDARNSLETVERSIQKNQVEEKFYEEKVVSKSVFSEYPIEEVYNIG
ncbi:MULTISPECIES: zinc-ribbon domain-containing protein [Parachlamydia]|uniref:zinc-ribbon domain-containing protein n=1 Tax=Parachlamydia TaxID=83551 RepID=UPI0001C17714|nr:zinc-ribbon domain-containing protein [Parachlamydia acanthamoebae]EFB41058.1 hypothetical protein pah_c050o006 [Parachlamydia acanthamoebae str. Hall's coccus]